MQNNCDYLKLLDEDQLKEEIKRYLKEFKPEHDAYVLAASAGMSFNQANRFSDILKRLKETD